MAIVMVFSHAMSLLAHSNRPGTIYYHGDIHAKKIALTFDDGPNEPYTSQVLSILRDHHVRATFFLLGKNVETFPDAARKIVQDGHAIGNHSYSHKDLVLGTNGVVRREITKGEQAIEAATGERPTLFRPPYGDKDFLTVEQTRKLGYVIVEWSVTAEDWRKPGVDHIAKNILAHVRNGSIILMHDGDKTRHGSDRSQTVEALPAILSELQRQGYEFVTIPELLNLPPAAGGTLIANAAMSHSPASATAPLPASPSWRTNNPTKP